jgi:hypothetical protein
VAKNGNSGLKAAKRDLPIVIVTDYDEFSSLDSFCKKTKTIAVPPQHLDQVTAPTTDDKHMSENGFS